MTTLGVKVLRFVVGFNLVLIALSWWPWFEGTPTRVGAVDLLLGSFRLGGFRADVVWLFLSTAFIAVSGIGCIRRAGSDPLSRINVLLCLIEVVAFCSLVYRVVTTGVLDFG